MHVAYHTSLYCFSYGVQMGCGKTVQAIALLQHYRSHWPALLLMPVGLMHQWRAEILRFSPQLLTESDVYMVKTVDKPAAIMSAAKIWLVAYTQIEKLAETKRLNLDKFGIVIGELLFDDVLFICIAMSSSYQ